MLRTVSVLMLLLVTSGCVTYSIPPRSSLVVEPAYRSLDVTGATVAVVLGADALAVEDGSAVRAHIGPGEDERVVLRTFLAERFPDALMQEAPFGMVFVVDAEDLSADFLRPGEGTVVPVGGRDADFVLYVDSLHQYRAKYPGNSPMNPAATEQAVRQDVDYRLWDNRVGREAARGRIESQEMIFLFPSRASYEQAVEEMAEQLTRELGVRRGQRDER